MAAAMENVGLSTLLPKRNIAKFHMSADVEKITRLRNRRIRRQRIIMMLVALIASNNNAFESVPRSCWALPRNIDWWTHDLQFWTDDRRFYKNFRMSTDTFDLLCHHLQGSLMKQDTHLRKAMAIPVNKRIAITLTRLAKNSDLSCISNTFGVGVSTVCTIYTEVCKAICQILTPIYLKKPTTSEMLNIIKGFEEKWGFPQCGGAIDGCHIPIISPSTYPADYYNRKGWHSVLLQRVVDHRYRFIDFDLVGLGNVMTPGSMNIQALATQFQKETITLNWLKTLTMCLSLLCLSVIRPMLCRMA
ncbi:protein ANTAGONIST OF LIKE HETEROCHROMATIN PROTEIN 1-like [Anneissia japonica]|uniref:protein ANTAGONIST OF LIKE HETEROCHROMATIN PROTEIN 1-like n=1 Tax=Anneissia japonica TaxID=1529436 RepID=UPI00142565EE|nr:protein ANTAGONIST OF LIKE HETEROCHROMATIN PROTEIN 1-like [Anneissia japonica]